MKNSIYLDHAATSPIASEVIDVMARAMAEESGNASSIHTVGRSARKALDESRASLAAKLNAKPSEIIFTSGGTEADNMAIFGTAYARQKKVNILSQPQLNTMPFYMRVKSLKKKVSR